MRERRLSDEQVWEEVAAAAKKLYGEYLDANQLGLLALLRKEEHPLDMPRNWDVPTGIAIRSSDAELV